MKKFIKWVSIILGSIIAILLIIVASIFISHDRYWFYSTGGKLSQLQSMYDVNYYDINLEVNAEEEAVNGYVNILLTSQNDSLSQIELDLIDNFTVEKVWVDDNPVEFSHNDDKLFLFLDSNINNGKTANIKVAYNGQPIEALAPPWIGGFNWSRDSSDSYWIGVSCQGEGGKVWFPCKTHPSDEPDSVAINITVPDPYFCASNGILDSVTTPKNNFSTYHWKTHYQTNNYNITVNIGKYKKIESSYISVDSNVVPVVYYYINGSENKAKQLVLMAIDMLKTLEKYYGEYPFAKEKFGLVETDYLGMEHQTINSYGNKYSFITRQGFKLDKLMLHEMSHEWWGNKVTVRDWADFWIHEGIGTYTEALYLEAKTGKAGYFEHMDYLKYSITNSEPIVKHVNCKSTEAYTGDIYHKGAWFMHSLRYAMGDSLFFKMLYKFSNDTNYTYQNRVVTEDFIQLVNNISGKDYRKFINLFLKTTDLPDFKIDTLSAGRYSLTAANLDFEIPVEVKVDTALQRVMLSNKAVEIDCDSIKIDPSKWYLTKSDFKRD